MPAQPHEQPKDAECLLQPLCTIAFSRKRSIADKTTPAAGTRSPECPVEAKWKIQRQRCAARLARRDRPYRGHHDGAMQMETRASSLAPVLPRNLQTEYCKCLCRWPR